MRPEVASTRREAKIICMCGWCRDGGRRAAA